MKEKSIYVFQKTESSSLWKWKGINFPSEKPENKLYPVAEYFQKSKREIDDVVLGPGVGAGIGCGVGLGLGVVGGAGVGGMDWNNLTAVFGIGIGCGIGVGFGYGQGFGGGFSLESFKSHLLKPKK